MRILLVHNYYRWRGGEDEVFEAEAALLESAGHEVIRWTRHNDDVDAGSPLVLAATTLWSRAAVAELAALCRRIRPEIAHFHNLLPLISPAACRAAADAGAATILTLHNYRLVCPVGTLYRNGAVCDDCLAWPAALPGIVHACYRGSRLQTAGVAAATGLHRLLGTWRNAIDRYIAPSYFLRDRLAGSLPADRIVVKPHFVPGMPTRGDGGGGYALFVGRLSLEKGVHTLLEAWRNHAPGLPLRIIGDGPLREDVAAATTRADIVWLGPQSYDDVLKAMRDALVVIAPSACYESFNRAVIDAYACGTPVVAAAHGATAELVEDGASGFRFPPGDAAGLASQVRRLTADPQGASRLRSAAHARYASHYSADENLRQLIAIYRNAIDASGNGGT